MSWGGKRQRIPERESTCTCGGEARSESTEGIFIPLWSRRLILEERALRRAPLPHHPIPESPNWKFIRQNGSVARDLGQLTLKKEKTLPS
ncbi:hypothetical protein CDAR_488381 [Caerostris darwini]|uniref:Uncharacterized protein n=1 Tax=Caerostris darwini TaxID=1538125 RepID=A0AAV4PYA2_9ARAC|nr:hypothetical protein CDAR_488381 [Caerostris darwini]